VFLIFLAAYRDRDYVEAATSGKLTIGTGDQDDAIALALAGNMTATDLDVSAHTSGIGDERRRFRFSHSIPSAGVRHLKLGSGPGVCRGLRTLPSLAWQIQCGISAQPFEQIRQLGDVHHNPSRLVFAEQPDRRAPARDP
jgi:hypothetical protein